MGQGGGISATNNKHKQYIIFKLRIDFIFFIFSSYGTVFSSNQSQPSNGQYISDVDNDELNSTALNNDIWFLI